MCPLCLTAGGLYIAGGLSTGAVTTFLATRWLRPRPEPTALNMPTENKGDDHAATDDRIEG